MGTPAAAAAGMCEERVDEDEGGCWEVVEVTEAGNQKRPLRDTRSIVSPEGRVRVFPEGPK